jgi:hypothetical protein
MLLVQKYGHYGKYGHLKYGYQKYGHHGILTPKNMDTRNMNNGSVDIETMSTKNKGYQMR